MQNSYAKARQREPIRKLVSIDVTGPRLLMVILQVKIYGAVGDAVS